MNFRDAYKMLKGMKPPTPAQKVRLNKAMMTPPSETTRGIVNNKGMVKQIMKGASSGYIIGGKVVPFKKR